MGDRTPPTRPGDGAERILHQRRRATRTSRGTALCTDRNGHPRIRHRLAGPPHDRGSATSLVIVADACRRAGLFLRAKRRCAGLSLRANDIDWSTGIGPEVTGPIASIVMAISGRPRRSMILSGHGLDTLRTRI
jgi:hypothetical protein